MNKIIIYYALLVYLLFVEKKKIVKYFLGSMQSIIGVIIQLGQVIHTTHYTAVAVISD